MNDPSLTHSSQTGETRPLKQQALKEQLNLLTLHNDNTMLEPLTPIKVQSSHSALLERWQGNYKEQDELGPLSLKLGGTCWHHLART